MELNKGSIIEIGECSKVTKFLPSGTIFKVLDHDKDYISIDDSLVVKVFNVNDSTNISYTILTLTDKNRTRSCYEGYCLSSLNGFKLQIVKIPNHKNGIE